ncbi:MAG: Folylpolyglutamate synthase, partial [uncultured bacterium]
DGAHNPDKMKALVGAIQEIWPERKVIVVLAIKNDKNATEMIDILKPLAQKFILTGYRVVMDQGEIVSYDTDDLAALMGQKRKVIIINDPLKAYDEAVNKTAGKDLILATGSLYLLGLIQKKINS